MSLETPVIEQLLSGMELPHDETRCSRGFHALGVGVAVAAQPSASLPRRVVVALVVVAAVVAPVWMGPAAPLQNDFEQFTREHPPQRTPNPGVERDLPSVKTVYWEQRTPEACMYRGSPAAAIWVKQTPAEFGDSRCGAWPFG